MLIEEITEFLATYFFSGYTIVNTIIYGLILVIAIFGIIKLFDYYKINPTDLILPLIPFVFLGSGVRALVDNGIYSYNWFLITPGIYFIVGGLTIATLIFSIYLERWKSVDFRYTLFIIGMIIAISNLININNFNLIAMAQVLIIWILFTTIFAVLTKFLSFFDINLPLFDISDYRGKINLSIISAHLLDASTTFIAVDYYGYFEQHILPDYIYNLSGTAITLFPLKIIVISISLYIIDKYIDNEIIAGTLKLAVFILGLAPGIRNLLTLAIGVVI
ncbi:MAG: DUF63 family protein [Methanobrevibacter sp.]|nr:DUF63 family protein [Methanobrevibacter sp.]